MTTMTTTPVSTVPDALRPLLVVHTAFRRDARALRTAIDGLDPADPREVEELASCFALTEELLAAHHHHEDHRLWPMVVAQDPDFETHAARLETDHLALGRLLTEVRGGLAHLAVATGEARSRAHRRLVGSAAALEAHLAEHLDREEALLVAVAHTSFTPEELETATRQLAKAVRWREALQVVPWALSAATPDERREAMASLPAPVRLVLPLAEGRFRRRFGLFLRSARRSRLAA